MPSIESHFIKDRPNYIKSLPYDLPSGLVVFLVALPLCLGVALASGAPLFAGIVAGVVGGIVVGTVSGSAVGVSGPAAGLTAIVMESIAALGYEQFLVAVMLAGVLQIILGFLKAGIIGYYFPTAVIKGMLAGIGLILILKQIPHALGDDRDYEGDWGFVQPDGENTLTAIVSSISYFNTGAVIITLVSLAILLVWELPLFKKNAFLKLIPAPLLVVLAGIGINVYYSYYMPEYSLYNQSFGDWENNHLVSIPYFSGFAEFLGLFKFPEFSALLIPDVYLRAATLAIVGSLETLLSVEATDRLDPYKRVTPTNRELKAQGLGNMLSGLLGGIPVTQVIVRSSANVSAGGRTKVAAIFHGILLLACVYFIPTQLNMIPLSCLAAILLFIGYKLAKIPLFVQMYKLGWTQFTPFVVTVLAILFTNLLQGIAIGMGVAIFYILRSSYHTPFYFHKEDHHEGDKIEIRLSEEVSFLNKASVMIMLEELPKDSKVIIDGSNANYIDHDVIEIIENFIAHAPLKNIEVDIVSIERISQDELERRSRIMGQASMNPKDHNTSADAKWGSTTRDGVIDDPESR